MLVLPPRVRHAIAELTQRVLPTALLYGTTNAPSSWPTLAAVFARALDGNVTSLYDAVVQPFGGQPTTETDLSRAAVACADSPTYASEREWPTAESMVNKTLYNLQQSPHFGAR